MKKKMKNSDGYKKTKKKKNEKDEKNIFESKRKYKIRKQKMAGIGMRERMKEESKEVEKWRMVLERKKDRKKERKKEGCVL